MCFLPVYSIYLYIQTFILFSSLHPLIFSQNAAKYTHSEKIECHFLKMFAVSTWEQQQKPHLETHIFKIWIWMKSSPRRATRKQQPSLIWPTEDKLFNWTYLNILWLVTADMTLRPVYLLLLQTFLNNRKVPCDVSWFILPNKPSSTLFVYF